MKCTSLQPAGLAQVWGGRGDSLSFQPTCRPPPSRCRAGRPHNPPPPLPMREALIRPLSDTVAPATVSWTSSLRPHRFRNVTKWNHSASYPLRWTFVNQPNSLSSSMFKSTSGIFPCSREGATLNLCNTLLLTLQWAHVCASCLASLPWNGPRSTGVVSDPGGC